MRRLRLRQKHNTRRRLLLPDSRMPASFMRCKYCLHWRYSWTAKDTGIQVGTCIQHEHRVTVSEVMAACDSAHIHIMLDKKAHKAVLQKVKETICCERRQYQNHPDSVR